MRKATTNGGESPKERKRGKRQRIFLVFPLTEMEDISRRTGKTLVVHDSTEARKQHREITGTQEGSSVLVEVLDVISVQEKKRLAIIEQTWGE